MWIKHTFKLCVIKKNRQCLLSIYNRISDYQVQSVVPHKKYAYV